MDGGNERSEQEVVPGGDAVTVDIRKTHPNLWRMLMVVGVYYLADGGSYLYYTPTFNPLHKTLVAGIYLTLGVAFMVTLNVWRHLTAVRATTAASVAWGLFWAVRNTPQVFAGHASMALPFALTVIALVQIPMLYEPATNPIVQNARRRRR